MGRVKRAINAREVAVIGAALERACKVDDGARYMGGLEKLRVVSRCACGCDTVDFATKHPDAASRVIADGAGVTERGGAVGLLIFADDDQITCLEVYDLGCGEDDIRLPTVVSIAAFSDTVRG